MIKPMPCPFCIDNILYKSVSKIKEIKIDNSEDFVKSTMEDIFSVLNLVKVKPKKISLFISPKWKYDLYKIIKKELEKTRDFKVIMGKVMQNSDMKKHSKEVMKIIQKTVKTGIDNVSSQEKEFKVIKESVDFFKQEFKANINVIKAEESKENKAQQASPGKVAILVE